MVAYFLRVYVFAQGENDIFTIWLLLSLLALAFPLMTSKDTFASAAQKSRLASVFLFKWLGIPRDSFTLEKVYPKRYSLVTAIGMVMGALTYFIHPFYYVMIAIVLMVVTLIFTFPEIGILGLIAVVPAASLVDHPSLLLLGMVAVTAASYGIKLLRGKRVIKITLCDFSVLAFSFVLLFSGFFGAGGRAAFDTACLYFVIMMGYFLTVNLIRTREWVYRCVITFLTVASLSGVLGVFQIFTGGMESSWLDLQHFSGINVRITSSFENPNVYASYLLLALPFALALLVRRNGKLKKTPLFACLLLLTACLVQTWSRGAWLGALVMAVLFFVMYSRRSLPYLLWGVAAVPVVSWVIPQTVLNRFLSIGTVSDTSSLYRVSAWRGSFKMLGQYWLSGIGAGEASFSAVYPIFSYAGVEGIHHMHNLYLQIWGEMGLPGILVFLLVIFLFAQNCFEYIHLVRKKEESVIAVAGLTAIGSALIMGLTDYIWYNSRIFLMFWLVMGLVNAFIRVGRAERNRSQNYENNTEYSVNFDLNVDNL